MAKKRLNTKFLALLAGGFVLGGGALGGLYLYAQTSPEEHVQKAREAEAAGDVRLAFSEYGKAAFEVRTDPDLYVAFADVAGKLTADDPEGKTFQQVRNALEVALQTDPNHAPALRRQLALQQDWAAVAGDAAPLARRDVPVVQEVRETAERLLRVDPADRRAAVAVPVATVRENALPGVALPEARLRGAVDALAARLDAAAADPSLPLDADVPYYLVVGLLDLADRARAATGATTVDPRALGDAEALVDRALIARPDDPRLAYRAGQAMVLIAAAGEPDARADRQQRGLDLVAKAGELAGDSGAFPGDPAPDAAGDAGDTTDDDSFRSVFRGAGATYGDVRMTYARVLEQRGDRAAAEAVYRKLLEARPYDLTARIALADLLGTGGGDSAERAVALLQGDVPRPEVGQVTAVEGYALQRALETRVPAEIAQLHLQSLLAATDAASRDARVALLQRDLEILRAGGQGGDTYLTLRIQGEIERARGEHVKAIGTLGRALARTGDASAAPELDPQRTETRFSLAQSHLALGQTGEARRLLADVARQPGRRAFVARVLLVQALLAERDPNAARAVADELFSLAPDNPVARALQVAAYADDPARARALIDAYPTGTADDRRRKLLAAYAAKLPDVAEPLARELLAEDATDSAAAQALAGLYAQQGDKDAARKVLTDLLAAKPGDEAVAGTLARLDAPDAPDDPIARLQQGVASADDPYQKLLRESQLYVAQGDQAKARATLDKAAQLEAKEKPRDPKAAEVLFASSVVKGEFAEAERYQKILADADADGLGGRTYRVQLLNAQGKAPEAVSVARQLVRDNADVAASHLALGRALAASGDYGRAADAYAQAVRQQPANLDALRGLIDAYLKTGQSDAAKQFIAQGRRVAPDDATFRGLETAWEVQYGDPVAAIEPAETAAAGAPDNPLAQVALGASTCGPTRRPSRPAPTGRRRRRRTGSAGRDTLQRGWRRSTRPSPSSRTTCSSSRSTPTSPAPRATRRRGKPRSATTSPAATRTRSRRRSCWRSTTSSPAGPTRRSTRCATSCRPTPARPTPAGRRRRSSSPRASPTTPSRCCRPTAPTRRCGCSGCRRCRTSADATRRSPPPRPR